jgi:hypothetical protein
MFINTYKYLLSSGLSVVSIVAGQIVKTMSSFLPMKDSFECPSNRINEVAFDNITHRKPYPPSRSTILVQFQRRGKNKLDSCRRDLHPSANPGTTMMFNDSPLNSLSGGAALRYLVTFFLSFIPSRQAQQP